jgi:hypothetical protein
MDSQSPPKGSLEELFRHHLLESEAAAVPPRPLVWDQIDNSLLLAENEKYRRRLLVHRWGMAASLLLAALAGGGWWHSQQPASPNLASATGSSHAAQVATIAVAAPQPRATLGLARTPEQATQVAMPVGMQSTQTSAWLAETSRDQEDAPASRYQRTASAGSHVLSAAPDQATTLGHTAAPTLATYAYRAAMTSRRGARVSGTLATATSFSYSTTQPIGSTATPSLAEFTGTTTSLGQLAGSSHNVAATAEPATAFTEAELVAGQQGEALLDSKSAQLALSNAGLPATLTPLEVKSLPATKLRQWRFGAEYAATAFNPNADFATTSYSSYPLANTGYSSGTPSFSAGGKSATAEYRANLRAGLGQRLSLRATRWLGGHWSLSTGLEAAQQHATSATSMGFDGVRLDAANSYNPAPRQLQASSYRYRSAGVPVELRYDNPLKSGVSLYGRLGAIVSALLNVRTEIAGNPETARSYSPFAGGTPYRRLTTLLRGGAGVRYRPAHKGWGVSIGPTAEAGVQSLNSDTDKNFLQQSRPYSFGLEAGFEFNSGVRPVQ